MPEPEPLRHNVSNYIHTAKKVATAAKGVNARGEEDTGATDSNDDGEYLTRESEIGPEVTHIYQIENKVHYCMFIINKHFIGLSLCIYGQQICSLQVNYIK